MTHYFPLVVINASLPLPGSIETLHLSETERLTISDWKEASKEDIVICFQQDNKPMSSIGVRAKILRCIEEPNQEIHCLIESLERVKIEGEDDSIPMKVAASSMPLEHENSEQVAELLPLLDTHFKSLLKIDEHIPEALRAQLDLHTEPVRRTHYILGLLTVAPEKRQEFLEALTFEEQLNLLVRWVILEKNNRGLNVKIVNDVSGKIDEQNKRYFIKEQINRLKNELDQSSTLGLDETERLEARLNGLNLPEESRSEINRELLRMRQMHSDSSEYTVSRNWMECVLSLPWQKYTEDAVNLKLAQELLDEHHHGLEKPKSRILEQLAVLIRKPIGGASILCFVGPPGVGKTSLGESIANAMGRKYQRIALGGIQDEAEIRGHRRTYVGAMPGRLIKALRRAECANPVIILDEIDKIGRDVRGDPSSALLELLDPSQNKAFVDHYVDLSFDCSQVLFVCTANTISTIPPALLDRLEIIRISGYTRIEKQEIVEKHLIPRIHDRLGLEPNEINITAKIITHLIDVYTEEAGVRNLNRTLEALHRKGLRRIIEGTKTPLNIDSTREILEYLGPPKSIRKQVRNTLPCGVALGMAWTATGGELLYIESISFKGSGKLQLTGQLGEVMKESAAAAISVLKNRATMLGIENSRFNQNDIHLHVPEGSIPKDGPSAGITIFCALYSMLSQRSILPRLAMSGEITLIGQVLPVGGIKEKCLAAHRLGVEQIILPKDNQHDYQEVPEEVRNTVKVTFVENIEQVIAVAFSAPLSLDLT